MNFEILQTIAPIAAPTLLLILSFGVKLTIERSLDTPKAVQGFIELPADMMFLATGLLTAYMIGNPEKSKETLVLFLGSVVLTIFVVFIWRKTELLVAKKSRWFILLTVTNYLVSFFAIAIAVMVNLPEANK